MKKPYIYFDKKFHLFDLIYIVHYYTPKLPMIHLGYLVENDNRPMLLKLVTVRQFMDLDSLVGCGNIKGIFEDEKGAQDLLESLPEYIERKKQLAKPEIDT